MSSEKWHADIQVTDELVKACLQEQFPTLMPLTEIKCIGEGWDNKVYLVNKKIIFRFPRRKIAVELIERENQVLKVLPSLIASNIAIPNPRYIGYATPRYPYPFQGYEILEGVSGCHAQLTEQERIASLAPLANFLKQLHSIDEAQALGIGARSQVFDRTIVTNTVNTLNERIDKIISKKLYNINKDCFKHEITLAEKIMLPMNDKCLIHGDLYCRHLMFNQGKLTGIIDWGDTGINNKSVDLAVIWSFYPRECHKQFFEIYGVVDAAAWQYARFLGLYSAFILILYGHDTGDSMLVTEAVNTAKRINPDLFLD